MRARTALACLTAAGTLMTGCSSSGPEHAATGTASTGASKPLPWDRPADQQAQVKKAGLVLTSQETLTVHYHAHLDVFVDGAAVAVPAGLGVNVGPDGQAPPHGAPGIAPLHTHDESGVLHIEAPKDEKFTLGQVFTEWGVALDSDHVGAYPVREVVVDGKPYDGDPAGIVLSAHEEIAVVAGTGTVDPPSSYAFPAGE
jgi:hypothetical protein